jgi:uncharacterized protein
MIDVTARVPTENAAKYVKQLCNHWSHKFEVQQSSHGGSVQFSSTTVDFRTDADGMDIKISGNDNEDVEGLKPVVEDHLNRFAFREAPLPFEWTTG